MLCIAYLVGCRSGERSIVNIPVSRNIVLSCSDLLGMTTIPLAYSTVLVGQSRRVHRDGKWTMLSANNRQGISLSRLRI